MCRKEKKRQERRAERLGGEENRAKDVEDLEQRIPGERGSRTTEKGRGKKGKDGRAGGIQADVQG